jgi:hypothetical protein
MAPPSLSQQRCLTICEPSRLYVLQAARFQRIRPRISVQQMLKLQNYTCYRQSTPAELDELDHGLSPGAALPNLVQHAVKSPAPSTLTKMAPS